MVETDQRLAPVFPEPPMLVYKRPPNIKNLLIRAKLPTQRKNRTLRERKVGFRRCTKRNNCRLCPYTGLAPGEIVGKVVVQHSGEEIPIKSAIAVSYTHLTLPTKRIV